jgi:hypothetical protein
MLEVIGVDGDPDSVTEFVSALQLDGQQGTDERADVGNLHEGGFVGVRVTQPAVLGPVLLGAVQDRVR